MVPQMSTVICLIWLVCLTTVQQIVQAANPRNLAFIGYHEKNGNGADLSKKRIIISTTYGDIKIKPHYDTSPKIVQLVIELALRGSCPACKLYRHEPVPKNWGQNGFYGDPYALLQGSLADMTEQPPFEAHPVVKRGHVCMIPNCKEFFIALADHPEWGNAHTVWGEVDEDSLALTEKIPYEPFSTITDKSNITTRWLLESAKVRDFQLYDQAA